MQDRLRQNIISIVKQKGISMSRLAEDAGLHKNFIPNFLYEKTRKPGLDPIAKIASALGVTIDELIGRKNHKGYDSTITQMDIFLDVFNHMLSFLQSNKRKELNLEKISKAIYEVYEFSLKKGSFDKEFADWFTSFQLQ